MFEPVIGLEVHAQLKTATKIFCSCSTGFGNTPNANTCPVCTGMPGVLPVLNLQAAAFAVKSALATSCTVQEWSRFDRKNYFYPDLPKGYQISQYAHPIALDGSLTIQTADEEETVIGITRIHMEEDAGKLIHDSARAVSMVDLNRTGVPLIEIVSEPDIRSAAQAGAYLRKLHSILRYIDVCDGNLEQGNFRCDANISLRPSGQEEFGTRTELKNLNSFRNVEKAIQFEIDRQQTLLEQGEAIVQETRLWDPDKMLTVSMRGKEEAHDYRYFPDPDLVPLIVDNDWIEKIALEMPELPGARLDRFVKQFGIPEYDAGVLTSTRELADYFEQTATDLSDKKQASNWIMGSVLAMLKTEGISIEDFPVTAAELAGLLRLLEKGTVNTTSAKNVFEQMLETGKPADLIVREQGLEQVSDQSELQDTVDRILKENPDEVEAYRGGKTKLFSFFMGRVMKLTKGKADPKVVTDILKNKL